MNSTFGRLALLATTVGWTAIPASADMRIRIGKRTLGTTNGGVYDVSQGGGHSLPPGVSRRFDTFCIEANEYLRLGRTYSVQISRRALYNNGGPAQSDPLDPRTAYLYSQWLDGVYARDAAHADAFQRAIWWLEGESGGSNSGLSGVLINDANAAVAVGGSWYNRWGPNSLGNIRVLNLFSPGRAGQYHHRKQDLLVKIPAPGAALLGAIGLGLAGWVRRRLA